MELKTLHIAVLLAPFACAAEGGGADETSGGVSTNSGTASETSAESDATDSSGSSSSDGESTTEGTSSSTSDSGSTDSTGESADTGSTDTSTTSTTDSTGTTGQDTGETGGGQQVFPGSDCDPFADECLDQGGNYECQQNLRLNNQNKSEVYFKCAELDDSLGDGMYGSPCHIWPYEQCVQGFWCKSAGFFPQNDCQAQACCIELCYFGQDCGGGQMCNTTIWEVDLADYLDMYGGIGNCP